MPFRPVHMLMLKFFLQKLTYTKKDRYIYMPMFDVLLRNMTNTKVGKETQNRAKKVKRQKYKCNNKEGKEKTHVQETQAYLTNKRKKEKEYTSKPFGGTDLQTVQMLLSRYSILFPNSRQCDSRPDYHCLTEHQHVCRGHGGFLPG